MSTRLLDPATGSGTFLITALRRYLHANAGRDPKEVLDGITKEFRLVAFDVNPFAVLMAQINAAALLVPLYTQAIEQDGHFVLRRLPIVRTDSLRQEVIEGERQQKGEQFGFDFGSDEITAYVELPIRDPAQKGEPLRVGITFPSLETAKNRGEIQNEHLWLLALQSVFAAVERISQAYDETNGRNLPDLAALLKGELALFEPNPEALTSYLEPYARGVWEQLKLLKERYGDGRFLKTLEDLTLGLVLKHYLQYDFVVGNPPYVRVQNIPEVQKKYWADKYKWAEGDMYLPFIERAFQSNFGQRDGWLKSGARISYVVSNSFLNTEAGNSLRKELPKLGRLVSISDFKAVRFKDGNLFKDAMTYTCIITVEKQQADNYSFRVARFYPRAVPIMKAQALIELKAMHTSLDGNGQNHLRAAHEGKDFLDAFHETSEALTTKGWYFMPSREREVFEKLEAIGEKIDTTLPPKATDQTRKLKNYTATESGGFAGIQTSLDSHMVLKQLAEDAEKGLLRVQPRGGGEAFWVEKEPLRPFLFGRDVGRWNVGWENWWVIFPYFRHSERFWFMPSTDYWRKELEVRRGKKKTFIELFKHWPDGSPMIDEVYPKLWTYLKANEKDFRGRESGRFRKKKAEEWRWYDLAYPRSLEAAEGKKIVAQLLARKAQFALEDEGGMHFQAGGKGGGVYGILPRTRVNTGAFLGLLNSKVLDFHLRQRTQIYNSSGSASYADAYLKDLPIPPATEDQQTAIAGLTQTLTEKTAALRSVGAAVAAFPDSVTAARRAAGNVPNLEALGRLGSLQGLPREVSAQRVSSEHDLMGQTVLRVGQGRMTLKPALAELVLEALKVRGKLEYEALASLNLPEREDEQRAYLAALREWQAQIVQLRGEIVGLEAELNSKVYEVYKMGDAEQTVIEGFLERF